MRRHALMGFAVALVTGAPLAAQSWETPTFFAPQPGEDIGLYYVSPEGSSWGLAGIWRQEGNLNMGVRAGMVAYDARNHYQVGAEFYGPLRLLGAQSELLFAWVVGAGATLNDVTWLRVPAGLSVGMNVGTPGALLIKPYVHPRVALDLFAYDNRAGDEVTETEFNVDLDLGADAALGEAFVLRVGVTLGGLTGDRSNTFGAGIAYRVPRRVTVR
jgi:hypothetical protein